MIQVGDILNCFRGERIKTTRTKQFTELDWDIDQCLDLVRTGARRSIDGRFEIDDNNRDVYRNLLCWHMGDTRMRALDPMTGNIVPGRLDKGLYIAGPTGSGKTMAMRILAQLDAKNPFHLGGKVYGWDTWRAEAIVDTYKTSGDVSPRKVWFLCIDDLGCEPDEVLYMGNRCNIMRSVLDYRGDHPEYVTVITSNIPLGHKDFLARYGSRVQSRVMEMCNYLELKGNDRRLVI